MTYVRFEAAEANVHGRHPGVFALANGLARSGRLSTTDHTWWRASNDWFDRSCPDPATADRSLFDRSLHPDVSCWFRVTAELLARVHGYLDLLDRYDVAWARRSSRDPGLVLYADDVQVVVAPHAVS